MPLDRRSKYGFVNENDEEALRDKLLDETTLYQPRVQLPEPSPLTPGALGLDMGTAGGQAPEPEPEQDPVQQQTPVQQQARAPYDIEFLKRAAVEHPTEDLDTPSVSNRQMGMMAGGFEKINAALSGMKPAGTAAQPFYKAADNQVALEKSLALKPAAKVGLEDPMSEVNRNAQEAFISGFPDAANQIGVQNIRGKLTSTQLDKIFGGLDKQITTQKNNDRNYLAQQAYRNQLKEQFETGQRGIRGRNAVAMVNKWESEITKHAPVVNALDTIQGIDPGMLRGAAQAAGTDDVFGLDVDRLMNALPAGVGTQGLGDPNRFKKSIAVTRFFEALARAEAGATFTPEEQVRLSKIFNDRLLSNPAATAVAMDMLRREVFKRLAGRELGLRKNVEYVDPEATKLMDLYADLPGSVTVFSPTFSDLLQDSDLSALSNPQPQATPTPNVQTQVTEPTPDQLGALQNQGPGSQIRVAPKVQPQAKDNPVQQVQTAVQGGIVRIRQKATGAIKALPMDKAQRYLADPSKFELVQ